MHHDKFLLGWRVCANDLKVQHPQEVNLHMNVTKAERILNIHFMFLSHTGSSKLGDQTQYHCSVSTGLFHLFLSNAFIFHSGFHNSYYPILNTTNLQKKKKHTKLSLCCSVDCTGNTWMSQLPCHLILSYCRKIPICLLETQTAQRMGSQPVDHSRIQLDLGKIFIEYEFNHNMNKPLRCYHCRIEATGDVKI